MRLNIPSYNITDANDYLIRHLFRTKPHLSHKEKADTLGIGVNYLTRKMKELKLHHVAKRSPRRERNKYFKRFDNAPWNRNIYFRKSAIETIEKYLKLWIKEQGSKNYQYLIMPDPNQANGSVIVYLPFPRPT